MSANVEISKRLVFINSASSLLAKVLNVSILVWLQQYLLRRISTEEYSLYPILMAVMLLVPLLTTILISGLSRYIVEAYARELPMHAGLRQARPEALQIDPDRSIASQ